MIDDTKSFVHASTLGYDHGKYATNVEVGDML